MLTDSNAIAVPEGLVEIVRSVFQTMMELDPQPVNATWFHQPDRLTATVHLGGAWTGAVLLECSRGLARYLAGRFLLIEPPTEVDDMVRDVLGELTNMIGGNLKCALAEGIQLSTPTVFDGSSLSLRICGGEVCLRPAFRCDDEVFWVTVLAVGATVTACG